LARLISFFLSLEKYSKNEPFCHKNFVFLLLKVNTNKIILLIFFFAFHHLFFHSFSSWVFSVFFFL